MECFTPPTRHWFARAFAGPTPVQEQGWQRIADGSHTLLIAPTGSGKTLAAFLYALDQLGRLDDDAEPGVRVLYVSPLKALVYDIERNLRTPLVGIERAAAQLGEHYRHPLVDIRTGDTPQSDRRRQVRDPGEIMVTTPESLFLLLGSQARETFRQVRWVIVDEIHAMAAAKRGDRPVEVVDAHVPPMLDLGIVVPVEDMTRPVVAFDPRANQVDVVTFSDSRSAGSATGRR